MTTSAGGAVEQFHAAIKSKAAYIAAEIRRKQPTGAAA
jgi:hypothetical protein